MYILRFIMVARKCKALKNSSYKSVHIHIDTNIYMISIQQKDFFFQKYEVFNEISFLDNKGKHGSTVSVWYWLHFLSEMSVSVCIYYKTIAMYQKGSPKI